MLFLLYAAINEIKICNICWELPGPSNTPDPVTQPRNGRAESSKGWEILKSIVYGGLGQLLASLSVVTSAASADATTCNSILSPSFLTIYCI